MKTKKIGFSLFLNIVFLLCLAGWVVADPFGKPPCMEPNSVLFGHQCGPPFLNEGDDGQPYRVGQAPNAGDGVSDGSGFDRPSGGPNGLGLGNGKGEPPVDHGGPAPNSGDGEPDGSGH